MAKHLHNGFTRALTAILVTTLMAGPVLAQPPENGAIAATGVRPLAVQALTLDREQFGITDTQWERYKTLMQGDAGLYYQNLSPVWVLGMYAKTPAERQRYAELAARQEKARLDRLLAFNRAWIVASDKINTGSPINQTLASEREQELEFLSTLDNLSRALPPNTPATRDRRRIALFTKAGCTACDSVLKKLLDAGKPLDIYLLDSGGDNATIQRWASERHIPKARVTGRATRSSITLNHDAGVLARLNPSAHAPALFWRDGNHYKPVTLKALGL